jgi:hypothetical protein
MKLAMSKFICICLAAGIVTLLTIDFVEAARGGRGGGKSMSRGGPAASGSFQRSRARPQSRTQTRTQSSANRSSQRQDVRQNRTENRQNRADNRSERVDNRQDFRNERYDDRKEFRGDRREWYEDRWRRGRFITATSWVRVGCNNVVIVNGIRYYDCGGVRYERVYRGSQVTYIIVN